MRLVLCPGTSNRVAYFEKALRESAHSVSIAADIEELLWLLCVEDFDAIVLFERTGEAAEALATHTRDVRERLQARSPLTWRAPLIFAFCNTASPLYRVAILRSGADACFCEPIYFAEVEARLRSFRRHSSAVEQHALPSESAKPESALAVDHAMPDVDAGKAGADVARLDAHRRALFFAGVQLTLSAREYLFVDCLLQQAPHAVSHEQLRQYCWSENEEVLHSVVGQTTLRLRKRMQSAGMPAKIESVPRFGYRLIFDA